MAFDSEIYRPTGLGRAGCHSAAEGFTVVPTKGYLT
jgi:hypothetical protein